MSEKNPQEFALKILWGALLTSHIIFLVLIHTVIQVEPKEFEKNILIILGGMALSSAFFAMFFKTKSYSSKDVASFFVPFILSLALAESVHIYGFAGRILGMPLDYYYVFAGLGLLLHLYFFPKTHLIGKQQFE